jgi:hypothetical protein
MIVQMPIMAELLYNYRSHRGILNLASSITDILYKCFPHGIDKLPRDKGLFDGPK